MTPTMGNIITELNRATVFSQLDLHSGYHQVELQPSSRYITTFKMHIRLFARSTAQEWISPQLLKNGLALNKAKCEIPQNQNGILLEGLHKG